MKLNRRKFITTTGLFGGMSLFSNSAIPLSGIDHNKYKNSRNQKLLLAQDYQIITRIPEGGRLWIDDPGLVRLNSGNLFATVPVGHRDRNITEWQTHLSLSKDGGKSWTLIDKKPYSDATPFVHHNQLYLFFRPQMEEVNQWFGDIWLTRSEDEGKTWENPVKIFEGLYWNLQTGMCQKEGYIYWALNTTSWSGPEGGVVVIAGDVSKDLLNPASWRISNNVLRQDTPEGLSRHLMNIKKDDWIQWKRDGWLEPNVVNVNGNIRVFSRCVIDGYATANIAAVCDVKDDKKKIDLSFSQFYAFPGGQCKFFIRYDQQSKLFWMASNLPTDSQEMIHDWDKIRAGRAFNGGPGNERRFLMLFYSADSLNWFQAGCIAMSKNPIQSFMYPAFDFDSEDIVLISRTSRDSNSQHDADLSTFHRIRNFRELSLDLFPEFV